MTRHLHRAAAAAVLPCLIAALALGLSACSSDRAGSDASSAASGLAAAAAGSAAGAVATVEKAKVISTGTVSLRADDVRAARDDVQRIADQYRGHLGDEDASTDEDGRVDHARLVLRIPAASYDQARQDLERVADLVASTTQSTDVTTQVTDVDERVAAMRASLDRMRTLLGSATKISDILRIESEITQREADLNSLLGQQAYLADQTSMSTITVDISRTSLAKAERKTGFLAGLSSGWDALTAFGTAGATVAGVLLPWLPVLVVLGAPAWLVLRRAGRTARTRSAA
ncbi:DUF4349 domain-containing protein [Nocardioides sp.]|uniref:DUF4349 domain-containing protein n=1 Tax=Nocardioides sp. TaxID=35761 RepID=UPI0039E427C4